MNFVVWSEKSDRKKGTDTKEERKENKWSLVVVKIMLQMMAWWGWRRKGGHADDEGGGDQNGQFLEASRQKVLSSRPRDFGHALCLFD